MNSLVMTRTAISALKPIIRPLLSLPIVFVSMTAMAEMKTISLELPSMNCMLCPFTVEKSLLNQDGVSQVDASLDTKRAVVEFDDELININTLISTTTNAGYPSFLLDEKGNRVETIEQTDMTLEP